MANPKLHVFDAGIYPRRLFVVRGKGKEKAIKEAFCTFDGEELDGLEKSVIDFAGAITWRKVKFRENGWLGALVWLVEDSSPKSLAHEAVHVACGFFEQLGVDMSYEHDEHFAYMVQWVTECLWEVVTGKGQN